MDGKVRVERSQSRQGIWGKIAWAVIAVGILGLVRLFCLPALDLHNLTSNESTTQSPNRPHAAFPQHKDPFQFIPCTNASRPPPLDDPTPGQSWAALYDPNPRHWSWGGRDDKGIYLCGYLDLPLDYHNMSDSRIVRLAITKFQVAGLNCGGNSKSIADCKSKHTIIIEPGGPGGSGTSFAWEVSEEVTNRFSRGEFDVLGWDPRGVNYSLPAASCFPENGFRDRWTLMKERYREEAPRAQLEIADAMNNATFFACQQRLGDFGRFISTAAVARDLDRIREALGEDEVTGYFVSYGTGIGQTFANMFPNRVGRMILDGMEYVKDHRLLGGFGWTSLDNTTDAWHDGFLAECIKAGPELCALARPVPGSNHELPVTLAQLETRMYNLLESLKIRPQSAYTDLSGPSLITYSTLVDKIIYPKLYRPAEWPHAAEALYELEAGNATIAAELMSSSWSDPSGGLSHKEVSPTELDILVICADSYDAPLPGGLGWWDELWGNMTTQSWIAGNSRFYSVLPCRYYNEYWPQPPEVYRGDLNHTLKTPILLISSPYDPATPLRNGRRLLEEMGQNARLINHHGFGHSSRRDVSDCTDKIGENYILHGILPNEQEVQCYANSKPYSQRDAIDPEL